MKIGQSPDTPMMGIPITPAANQKSSQNASSAAVANANQSTRSVGVSVTVSTLARSLEAAAGNNDAADVDTKKINAVRTAIEQGTFSVDAEAIADKLLSNASEMLKRSRN